MKILHTVLLYSPSVGGSQEVIKRISELLAAQGHEVTVATTQLAERKAKEINGVHIEEFEISGNTVQGFSGETQRYQEFLRHGLFDVMLNYAAQQWATDLVFPILQEIPFPKVLAPCGFSALYEAKFETYFAQMPIWMAQYDRLAFHGTGYRDYQFAKQHSLSNLAVVPNGAAESEFGIAYADFRSRFGIPANVPLLLTVGSHTGTKGHDLAISAFGKAKIGKSVLVVIGNQIWGPGCLPNDRRKARRVQWLSLGQKRVLLLDPPRTDVVAAFQAADLFVFGSNIECSPIVLFEAMASKTPFITTRCGNSSEIADWSKSGIVLPTQENENGSVTAQPQDLAYAIEELIHNSQMRKQLAENGYSAWRARFTWEKIAGDYEQLYRQVSEKHKVSGD